MPVRLEILPGTRSGIASGQVIHLKLIASSLFVRMWNSPSRWSTEYSSPSWRGAKTRNSPSGVFAVQEAAFGRRRADRGLHQVTLVVRAVNAQAIKFVLLFVDELVVRLRLADRVAKELVRPLGGVLGDVEDGLAVAGPGKAGDFDESVFKQFARLEVFN